ncbi:uncharacterized protein LOC101741590 isoform X2 [Bombyx mori]|uniref:PWWP domain-containing protein n=1 Tax=Bombyx mori TaxID=7091 RepID=A0A8R2AL48_BOMMO|nr:uncharacterized protein LOC101741590 isoform X2 [Bombyx mori]
MAAVVLTADMTIEKNSKILVNVEEALADLLVVSYCTDDKKFQGVLLDSSKSNLPFGVYSLHPAFSKRDLPTDGKDKLHSVSQRFLYQDPDYAGENGDLPKRPMSKGKAQARQKMTVRLRPRKVLCSNCKGICNENNENVDVSKKRKLDDDEGCHSESSKSQNKYLKGSMLIPKLSRLEPSEIASSVKSTSKSSKASEKQTNKLKNESRVHTTQEVTFVSVSNVDIQDPKDDNEVSFTSMFSNAKTLKICFGEGEGTVVKIPPLSGDFNEDSGVSCDMTKPELKAAKKALRKAKKQARKGSEKTPQSSKHMGALSPRNSVSNSPSRSDNLEKKHKHRVKHKKKYKAQKKGDENTSKCNESKSIDYFRNIKDHCMNQKLSINLRRLSSNSYEKCGENEVTESGSDEWESETVPEFPPTSTEGLHFNKKKRGPYKEAVKQATLEAKRNESQLSDPLASPTHLATLSPRPIDVFS